MSNRKTSSVLSVRMYADEHKAVLDLVEAVNASPACTMRVRVSDVLRGILLAAAAEGATPDTVAAIERYT